MAIYTKKGDKGTTSLIGSKKKLPKSSLIFDVLGTIDEAISILGIVKASSFEKHLVKRIQKDLFLINSIIAGFNFSFPKNKVSFLERKIDEMEKKLPSLKSFILPGDNLPSSYLHLARAVIRRGERMVVSLSKKQKVSPTILAYLNRLSDLLFEMARESSRA